MTAYDARESINSYCPKAVDRRQQKRRSPNRVQVFEEWLDTADHILFLQQCIPFVF